MSAKTCVFMTGCMDILFVVGMSAAVCLIGRRVLWMSAPVCVVIFGFADVCGRLRGCCVGCANVCSLFLRDSLFLRMSAAVPVVFPLVAGMSAAVCVVARKNITR
jgi:hypothetical protein